MAVLLNSSPASLAEEALPHKTWTRNELLLVEDTGVFADTHFELIDGELIDKMGKKYPHVRSTRQTVIVLEAVFGQACVLQEAPIDVAPEDTAQNEPEPDVTVLRSSFRDRKGNPQPSEIALVVEIADTTLRNDLTTKASLYARAGIAEYWVLNLKDRRLHVLRDPIQGSYAVRFEIGEADFVSPLDRPEQKIALATLLG
ncbi:MAG: Uma2 family endonuclease [Acidobacteriota bacterium]